MHYLIPNDPHAVCKLLLFCLFVLCAFACLIVLAMALMVKQSDTLDRGEPQGSESKAVKTVLASTPEVASHAQLNAPAAVGKI